MNGTIFLWPALLLPWVGRWSGARASLLTRWINGLLHLSIVAAWTGGAFWLALPADLRPLHGGPAMRWGTFALVLAGGFLYTELIYFFPRRRGAQATEATHAAPHAETESVGLPANPGALVAAEGEAEDEPLSREGEALLARILSCESRTVNEVMTPRDEIIAVAGAVTVEAALALLRTHGRSRVIVIEGSVDRILGVAHAKDLVPLQLEGQGADPIRLHLRRWLRVPSGAALTALLEDFRANRVHLGIVSDQLGKTLGLVTLHDVSRFFAGGARGSEATS